jgi:Xaa-Pro aminopeptidase
MTDKLSKKINMIKKVPLTELKKRMRYFQKRMNLSNPEWERAFIFSKINIYYFTGTIQDGMLIIPKNGEATFWCGEAMKELWTNHYFLI